MARREKRNSHQLTQRRDESPPSAVVVGGQCSERTKDRPVAGQWAQTGFKDFDGTVPRTANPNWIRISRKSTKGSKSKSIPVYHWPSGPS